jgi:hypothetical protein
VIRHNSIALCSPRNECDAVVCKSQSGFSDDFMTLHVGLIGCDGFVIASDTLRTVVSETMNNPQRSSTPKINIKNGLVWAMAGYQPHCEFGDELLKAKISLSTNELRIFAKQFFQSRQVEKQTEDILVGHVDKPDRLWQIKAYVDRRKFPDVTEILDRVTNQAAVCAHFIPTLFCTEPTHTVAALIFPVCLDYLVRATRKQWSD